jgi:hypothetical protein
MGNQEADDLYCLIASSRVKRFTYIEPLAKKGKESPTTSC